MRQGQSRRDEQQDQDDLALCAGIHRRNIRSEAAFFEKYRASAIACAARRVDCHGDAEDLAHDALLIVMKRLQTKPLSDPTALPAFVRRTVEYAAIGFLRKQVRRRTSLVGDWPEHLSPVGDQCFESVVKERTRAQVLEWIGRLTQHRDRELLCRSFLEEQPKPIICGALSVSPAQFDRLIYRAKARLRIVVEGNAESALS